MNFSWSVWTALTGGLGPSSTPLLPLLTLPPSQFLSSCSQHISVTKLTSFQAHVSSEASPMLFGCDLLTKYRPWQIGLTRQEKHKPGDELRTQTRSQIHLFERTRVHILHTQFVSTVCARTHRYDDGHSSVHSKRWRQAFPNVIQST